MKILIVSATTMEIAPLISYHRNSIAAETKNSTKTPLKNLQIDFLITGIGMVATAYHLGKALINHYDLAINMGICGTFNPKFAIGAVVNVVEDQLAEMGAEEDTTILSMEEMNLEAVTGVDNREHSYKSALSKRIFPVKGITVNKVHGNERSIHEIINRFHPDVESMEGAAFLYACKQAQIPCIQVRAISNVVEKRNKEKWNIPLAITNLNEEMIEFVNTLALTSEL